MFVLLTHTAAPLPSPPPPPPPTPKTVEGMEHQQWLNWYCGNYGKLREASHGAARLTRKKKEVNKYIKKLEKDMNDYAGFFFNLTLALISFTLLL